MSRTKVIIGTRGSDLALWQANTVGQLLSVPAELKIVQTSGDRFLGQVLQGQFTQGFFTKELEELLLAGEIDLAVHSLKDLPTECRDGLAVGAILPRAAVNDLLLVNPSWHDSDALFPVREGCQVGATSLRRQALLKLYAPHVAPTMLRGNVPTRVRKCAQGEYGAIVLAQAGVERLGLDLSGLHCYQLDAEAWLPAPGQGAVAVQVRAKDSDVIELLSAAEHAETRTAVSIERAVLANYEGGCHTAFGAWARHISGSWKLNFALEEDGAWLQFEHTGSVEELSAIGPANQVRLVASNREARVCSPCGL